MKAAQKSSNFENKKKSSVLFTAFSWKYCVTIMICCTILFLIQLFPENLELNFYFRQYN